MSRSQNGSFTTGEFAKYFGIKKDTLFYYDRLGLFSPIKIATNGYRYYSSQQIDTFWMIEALKKSGISLKQIQAYLDHAEPKNLLDLLEQQLSQIDHQLVELQQLKNDLLTLQQSTAEGSKALLSCPTITKQKWPILQFSRTFTAKDTWNDVYSEFCQDIDFSPQTPVGSVISQTDLLQENFDQIKCLFIHKGQYFDHPLQLVMQYYHQGDYASLANAYPILLDQLEQKNYQLIGDAYEEYLIGQLATTDPKQFVTKITIPIKKKSS